MPAMKFDRYYKHSEIESFLNEFAKEYPNLVQIEVIGKSHEGRNIYLATLTDKSSGSHDDKPAFWCDGNIHASEVSASTAVLHLIHKLCTGFGKDEQITQALKTRTFYLVPRLNPDGAEWSLETPPRVVRSSTRPYPYDDQDIYGLERKDLDGDGKILSIRIEDPNGGWKICEQEPRLLVRREPADFGGKYYRVIPEGVFHNWDGITIKDQRIQEGLDMNRNFPSAWRAEYEQYGAGEYPTSEPEIRACVQAIVDRQNICGAITFHTFSGVLLRPSARYSDSDMAAEDLWAFQKLGSVGKKMTGYPDISNFHEFKYHPKESITGTFDDWAYEMLGVYAWTIEIWSPQRQAGITDYKYIDWFREHPNDDEIKLLKWSDEKLDGKGYVEWKEFDHPQLGKVEIGGWDSFYAFRNPPTQFLEAEVSPLGDWAIWHALCSPCLELREAKVEAVEGTDCHRVRVVVQNSGWLPTNVSKIAEQKKMVRGVWAEILLDGKPAGKDVPSWLVSGLQKQQQGQLMGRNHISAGAFGWQTNGTSDTAIFEWVIRGKGKFDITVKHPRAGTVRTTVTV